MPAPSLPGHHCLLCALLLLTALLQLPHPAYSDICTSSVCEFELVISMQQSLVYKPPGGPPGYFDVDLDPDGQLRVVNSTFRPTANFPEFINQTVPDARQVITLDGVKRNVFTINGQFPGPTLEVMEGAKVAVHVKNMLHDQSVTMHFHGLPQRLNAWMDGVPDVTQCTIPTGDAFTYRFTATPAGTFWYHSHFGYQRVDGLSGFLLVHTAAPTIPYFPVLLQEWYHQEGHVYMFTNPLAVPEVAGAGGNLFNWFPDQVPFLVDGSDISIIRYVSGIINGRGRFNKDEPWPLTEFEVVQNKPHLFRLANVGGEVPLQVSIDDHQLRIMALDGVDIEPMTVDSLILYGGERADVELYADKPVGRYWMRSRYAKDDSRDGFTLETLAIVRYAGTVPGADPTSSPRACTEETPCRVFNCPFKYFPPEFNSSCVHMEDARRSYAPGERAQYGLEQVEPDEEYFVNLMYFKGANLNGINNVGATSPFYQTDSETVDCEQVCPQDDVCSCTHRLFLPFNKTIQLVISNFPPAPGEQVATHPVHVHGHHFAVVLQGFANFTPGNPIPYDLGYTPNPDVVCDDFLCRRANWRGGVQPTLNLLNPPLKDTTISPAAGYTVIRFRSDNPGPWLVHCHMTHHNHQGPMSFLLIEGEDHFPPVPPNMPTCTHNFSLTTEQFSRYQGEAQAALNTGRGFQKVSPHFQTPPGPTPRPTNLPPRKPPTFPGPLDLGLGGILGVAAAGLVGGILLTVATFAIWSCCTRHHKVAQLRSQTHLQEPTISTHVVPVREILWRDTQLGTPTYITAGPTATSAYPLQRSTQYGVGQRPIHY